MKSVLKSMNRKGQMVNQAVALVASLAGMLFIVFGILYGISALNPTSFFTASSLSYNSTLALQDNLTGGIGLFSQKIPVVFTVLGVILVLGAIAYLIIYIRRSMVGGTGSGGSF